MGSQKGYISAGEFVPSSDGRYTRDDKTGIVTDSRSGKSSGASYDVKHLNSKGDVMVPGVIYDAEGNAKSYISDSNQIVIGSKSDTKGAQSKANIEIEMPRAKREYANNGRFFGPIKPELIDRYNQQNSKVSIKEDKRIALVDDVMQQLRIISAEESAKKNVIKSSVLNEEKLNFRQKIQQIQGIQEIKASRARAKGDDLREVPKSIVIAAGTGAALGVLDFVDFVKSPVKTTKETAVALTKRETYVDLGEEFRNNPAGVVARFYTFGKVAGFTGKVIKNSPVVRGILEENFVKAQPKNLQPKIRAILRANRAQEKVSPVKAEDIKEVSFKDIQNLNRVQARAIKVAAKKTDAVVFGSKAGRVLSGGKTKVPADTDVAVSNVSEFNKQFIKALPKSERANIAIKKQKIKNVRTGDTLADVKPLSRLIPNKNIVTGKGRLPITGYKRDFSFIEDGKVKLPTFKKKLTQDALSVPTQKLVKVDDLEFVSFGEQTTRKGLGSLTVLIEKNIRRVKDTKAYVASLKIQSNFLKQKGGILDLRKARIIDESIKTLEKDKLFSDLNKYYVNKNKNLIKSNNIPIKFKIIKGDIGLISLKPIYKSGNIVRFYHGTKLKNVDNIFKKGLVIGKKSSGFNFKEPYVSVSIDKKIAKAYAGDKGKVIEINIPIKDFKNLIKKNKVFQDPFSLGEPNFAFSENIKAKYINKNKFNKRVKNSKVVEKRVVSDSVLPEDSSLLSVKKSSVLPLIKASKIPSVKVSESKIPRSKKSKLPSSKVPGSRVPPSKVPDSKIPKKDFSFISSSKLPSSKVPGSRVSPSKVPESKVFSFKVNNIPKETLKNKIRNIKKITKKMLGKGKSQKFDYTFTLVKAKKKLNLKEYSGLEYR